MNRNLLTPELLAVLAAGLSGFVETHIWSPAYSYYLLLVLVVLDVLINNYLKGQPLRARRLGLRLLGYTVILAFAHGFSKGEPGLFFLSQLALAPFVIIHLRSLIIALGKLGWVDPEVAALLETRIRRRAELEAQRQDEAPAPEPEAEVSTEPTVADEAVSA